MESLNCSHPHRVFLRITSEDLANTTTIRPAGELDTVTAPELLNALRHVLLRRPTMLAVDLSDVEFLGVAGLEVLLRMRRVVGRSGTAFALIGDPNPEVTWLLGLVGLAVTTPPHRISGASALGRPITRTANGRVRYARDPLGAAPLRSVPS